MFNINNDNVKKLSMFNSLVHSALVSVNSGLYLFNYIDLNKIKKIYVISICYFIIDYIIILNYYDLKDKICYFFHHFITSYILYIFLYENKEEDELNQLIAQGFTAEFPIIFLDINWFLIKYKKQNTILFRICDHLTVITYFIFRICNFTYLLFVNYYKYEFIIKMFSIVYALNAVWFTLLLKRFQRNCLKYNKNFKED